MNEPPLICERQGSVAILTLNRPHAMNALSQTLRRSFCAHIRKLETDPEISACIVTGAGIEAFCAGLDLKEIRANATLIDDATGSDPTENPAVCLLGFTKPLIAAVNGVAITGGLELMMSCDVVIASVTARFADTHARVGLLPAWGLSQKLSRLIGPYRAKELSFTGRFLDAAEARDWGLVNQIVGPDLLMDAAGAIARDITNHSLDILQLQKHLIDEGYSLTLREGLALEEQMARAHNPR